MTLSFAFLALTSCNDDEASFTNSVKSVATISQTNVTMTEGQTVPLTITLNRANNVSSELKIEVVSGTGTFRDFTVSYGAKTPLDLETYTDDGYGYIGYKLAVPAYATTFTFDLNAVLDFEVESTETLVLKLSTAGNGNALVAANSELITVTVNPGTSNNFVARMEWDNARPNLHGNLDEQTYIGADDKPHSFCGFDFDLEIYDENFNPVIVDYDNCPAETILPANAPNGVYIIVPSFWSRTVSAGSVPKSLEIIYPVKMTMAKPGVFVNRRDMTGLFKYSLGGAAQNNPNAYIPIAVVTKTGTTYVLTDYVTGSVLAQGKMNNFVKALKNKKAKK